MVGAPAGAANPLLTGGAAKGGGDAPPLVVTPVDGANALAARVAELEQRLSRITLQAESASGNASRAEGRSEEHTSELQSLMRISYAVFCLKKKKTKNNNQRNQKIR